VYVVDEKLVSLPKGCAGEIVIGGILARGYLNMAEETASKFVADPRRQNTILYRSGDIGRWTEGGDLEYLGRRDSQVKLRGARIETTGIENVILEFPGIKAAVVMVDDEQQPKGLVAFVVAPGCDIAGLQVHLRRYLPFYQLPYKLIPLANLPSTINGKVDRSKLRSCICGYEGQETSSRSAAAETETESLLLQIWRDVLEKQQISVLDNFFDLGGHSLKASQVVSKIYQFTGLEIGIADFFTRPTIREIGEVLDRLDERKFTYLEI
jgi:tyrocidine synthetase-3